MCSYGHIDIKQNINDYYHKTVGFLTKSLNYYMWSYAKTSFFLASFSFLQYFLAYPGFSVISVTDKGHPNHTYCREKQYVSLGLNYAILFYGQSGNRSQKACRNVDYIY